MTETICGLLLFDSAFLIKFSFLLRYFDQDINKIEII